MRIAVLLKQKKICNLNVKYSSDINWKYKFWNDSHAGCSYIVSYELLLKGNHYDLQDMLWYVPHSQNRKKWRDKSYKD